MIKLVFEEISNIRKNYKIKFTYDGYRFYDVVEAESPEQAIDYLTYLDSECIDCSATETDEEPTYIVPDGWERQKSKIPPLEGEERDLYYEYLAWVDETYGDFYLWSDAPDFDTWLNTIHNNK